MLVLGNSLVEDVVHHVLEGVAVKRDLVPHDPPNVEDDPTRDLELGGVISSVTGK